MFVKRLEDLILGNEYADEDIIEIVRKMLLLKQKTSDTIIKAALLRLV